MCVFWYVNARLGSLVLPIRCLSREDWNERLGSVLNVVYLIFNEGYSASGDENQDAEQSL